VTQERTALPPPRSDASPGTEVDVRTHANAAVLAATPEARAAAVDALLRALAAVSDASRKSALLRALLDDHELTRQQDRLGVPVRETLVKLQLELGFPHALEVNPDDLRKVYEGDPSITPRALAVGLGLCTAAWGGLMSYGSVFGALMDSGEDEARLGLGGMLFLALALYGAVATVLPISQRGTRALGATTFRVFGWAGVLGPVLAAGLLSLGPGESFAGTLVLCTLLGMPAILVGWAGLKISAALRAPPPKAG
jgi:hypothetical protein